MTYKDAMAQAILGKAVREKNMIKGWKVVYIISARDFFNINPHNGSNYHFTPTSSLKQSNDWEITVDTSN